MKLTSIIIRIWTAGWLAIFLTRGLICSGQTILSMPSYLGCVHFADSQQALGGSARLVRLTSVWVSDMLGIMCSNSMSCPLPEMNSVILGEGYPGTNWVTLTGTYSDGTVITVSTNFTAKGFKFWTADGSPLFSYGVKAHLEDYSWTLLSAGSPMFGYLDASSQFFRLPTNVVAQFYQDTVPIEQPQHANDPSSAMPPPMP